ncbi:hypothetical protein OIU79_002116 [Salix purpurea]|uniref:Uncharacterized protein n=1 Tax=Salix purpurea TaxID=77065 RepID=A0A9Q0URE2_SALPP|nr:hypothetical protein OIU79_002116 [Salix purpurea]
MSFLLACFGNNTSKKPGNPPTETVESRPAAAKGAAGDATSSRETFYAVPERTDAGGQREIGHDSAAAASENIYLSFLMHPCTCKIERSSNPGEGLLFLGCRKEIKPLLL